VQLPYIKFHENPFTSSLAGLCTQKGTAHFGTLHCEKVKSFFFGRMTVNTMIFMYIIKHAMTSAVHTASLRNLLINNETG
jgi:hypothetical protein